MHRSGGTDGKFKIKHLSPWRPQVEPFLAVGYSQIEQPFRPITYIRTPVRLCRENAFDACLYQLQRATRNSRIVAISAADRDGSQEENNQVFDNADVRRISLWVNSTQFPEREREVDYRVASRNYGRTYMMFQEAVQKKSQ